MQGKRAYPDENGFVPYEPGVYWKDNDGLWWIWPPKGAGGCLAKHTIVEHEDGTITVSPSILVHGPNQTTWHGYLEKGVWREC